METCMTVFHNDPQGPHAGLSSKRIYINQDVKPGCDGVHHLYIPACELEILVCRESRTYVAMGHMCPCGAVSTDRGRTWETAHWAMMPSVIRVEPVSTVTNVEMSPDATIAPNNITARRVKLATLTSFAMLASGFFMGIILNFLLVGIFATLASPHVWWWAKVRAPQWWAMLVNIACATPGFMLRLALILLATIVSLDLALGRMVLNLKIWLKALPKVLFNLAAEVLLYILLISYFIVLVIWEVNVNIWNGRPRVLRANLQGYAFALLIVITMLVAGIR